MHTCVCILNDRFFAGPTNTALINVSTLSDSNVIGCSFLNNQSFYCVVCCSTDPSVPSDSSVYNISTTRGTEVTVSLQGLTSGQMYYCKAAASNTNSTRCAGPVVGDVKLYFSFVASIPYITQPSACKCSLSYNSCSYYGTGIIAEENFNVGQLLWNSVCQNAVKNCFLYIHITVIAKSREWIFTCISTLCIYSYF